MSHGYIPRFLNRQGVGVQLGDEKKVGLVLSGVDYPKTVLIYGQVKVVAFRRIQILCALYQAAINQSINKMFNVC